MKGEYGSESRNHKNIHQHHCSRKNRQGRKREWYFVLSNNRDTQAIRLGRDLPPFKLIPSRAPPFPIAQSMFGYTVARDTDVGVACNMPRIFFILINGTFSYRRKLLHVYNVLVSSSEFEDVMEISIRVKFYV